MVTNLTATGEGRVHGPQQTVHVLLLVLPFVTLGPGTWFHLEVHQHALAVFGTQLVVGADETKRALHHHCHSVRQRLNLGGGT